MPNREQGTTFLELMAAMSIIGIALLVMTQQLTLSYRENSISVDKAFAYRKALGMLSEINATVYRGAITEMPELDLLADTADNPVLTTMQRGGLPFAPDDPASANHVHAGSWRWYRRISVDRVEGADFKRYVHVDVRQRQDDGRVVTAASAGSIVTLLSRPAPKVKEYDVYLLAIANETSSWMPIPSLRPLLRAASSEISTLNPGLRFKLHWITKLGYGRDPMYAPFVNVDSPTDAAAPWAFAYPGNVGDATIVDPELVSGRLRSEAGLLNGYDITDNPVPYAVADRFNHCARTPVAREIFDARVAAGLENADEPPLQILLADMASEPQKYENALFLNLHGEGLPFPPMRNYADPAKVPSRHPGVRVVTHPAMLHTRTDSELEDTDDVELRVYAFKTDPSVGPAVLSEPITVQILGVDLSDEVNGDEDETLQVRRAPGGVDVSTGLASGTQSYTRFTQSNGEPPEHASAGSPFEMSYECGYSTTPVAHTWIRLHNTPLTTPRVGDEGLDVGARLYGLEYVPTPSNSSGFSTDLASDRLSGAPCNTARWQIRIPASAYFTGGKTVDTRVDVITRIGSDMSTGRAYPTVHEPHNYSRTHAWWTASIDAVPLTERYQFLGDPRHNPYADLVRGGGTSPNGYNWFFDDLRDGAAIAIADWPAIDPTRIKDGVADGVHFDAPRMLQVWREALRSSNAVFANARGAFAGTMLLGGGYAREPEGDGLGWRSVPVHGALYGTSYPVAADTLTTSIAMPPAAPPPGSATLPRIGQVVVRGSGVGGFWSKLWLGEIVPDSEYASWLLDGNLPAGSGAGQFHRALIRDAVLADLPAGTRLDHARGAQLGLFGAGMFAQSDAIMALQHLPQSSGSLLSFTDDGLELLRATGLAGYSTVEGRLPFSIGSPLPGPFGHMMYSEYPDQGLTQLRVLSETSSSLAGSAVLSSRGSLGGGAALLMLHGDSGNSISATEKMARRTLVNALTALHVAGEPGWALGISMVPMLQIVEPIADQKLSAPSRVVLRWRSPFVRFDGAPFTSAYGTSFTGDESNNGYRVLVSADEGATWRVVGTGLPAEVGVRPQRSELISDSGPGDESLAIDLPAVDYPRGSYLFRVECFHVTRETHSSHHQVRVWIDR